MIFVSKEAEESGEEEYEEEEQDALLKSLVVLFVFLPPAFVFVAFELKDDDVDEPSE
jgi:hypothetical protein|tara:strand:+ start:3905 stop:4075 length:171 start_codon:yes stop_codon:yes gene_type:complete